MSDSQATEQEWAAFKAEFDKLGYLWSVGNQHKAFVGWKLARAALANQRAEVPQQVVAWAHEHDPTRVISDAQKQQALRDGGASASSVKPYSRPAFAALTTINEWEQSK